MIVMTGAGETIATTVTIDAGRTIAMTATTAAVKMTVTDVAGTIPPIQTVTAGAATTGRNQQRQQLLHRQLSICLVVVIPHLHPRPHHRQHNRGGVLSSQRQPAADSQISPARLLQPQLLPRTSSMTALVSNPLLQLLSSQHNSMVCSPMSPPILAAFKVAAASREHR